MKHQHTTKKLDMRPSAGPRATPKGPAGRAAAPGAGRGGRDGLGGRGGLV